MLRHSIQDIQILFRSDVSTFACPTPPPFTYPICHCAGFLSNLQLVTRLVRDSRIRHRVWLFLVSTCPTSLHGFFVQMQQSDFNNELVNSISRIAFPISRLNDHVKVKVRSSCRVKDHTIVGVDSVSPRNISRYSNPDRCHKLIHALPRQKPPLTN